MSSHRQMRKYNDDHTSDSDSKYDSSKSTHDARKHNPDARKHNPDARKHNPDARKHNPGARKHNHDARKSDYDACKSDSDDGKHSKGKRVDCGGVSKKYKTVSNGVDGYITISMDEYVNGINSWNLSLDAISLCYNFGIVKEDYLNTAAKTSISVKTAMYGVSISHPKERELLFMYGIGVVPVYTSMIRKNIAYLKWIITANIKNNNIDNELVYYIGFIAGICMYINEQDLISSSTSKQTSNYKNLCTPFTTADNL